MKQALLFIAILSLSACSTYKNVGLKVEHPAVIDLKPEVKKVTFVNRTIPKKGNTQIGSVIEAVVSGESIMADRLGAKSALDGMQLALTQSDRLLPVGGIVDMTTTTVLTAPPAFTWDVIDSLCKANGSDMIVACEFFDSDQVGTVGGLPMPNVPTDGSASVRAYFRVYDNLNKTIVDEQMMRYRAGGGGGTIVLRGANNIERKAYGTGYNYGRMLVPFFNFEKRDLYHAGSRSMRSASKLARSGNWEAAKSMWLEMEGSGSRRKASRAAFNLALENEVRDDLDQAMLYAERAFSMKPKSAIARYMRILTIRIDEQDRLKKQKGK